MHHILGEASKRISTPSLSVCTPCFEIGAMSSGNPTDDKPADFCFLGSPQNRLSQFERLTLVGGRELDRALAYVGRQILQFSSHTGLNRFEPEAIREAYAAFVGTRVPSIEALTRPRRIGAAEVSATPVHGLKDGVIEDLVFQSSYVPLTGRVRETFDRHPENRSVHARWWRHTAGAAATLVGIHGWNMGDQRLNSLAFLPGIFYRLGLDVVLFELPFHGRRRRASSGEAGNGVLFPNTDLALTNEAMFQAIADLRELHGVLSSCGANNVGAIGMSLGGYVASVWAGVAELAFCIPVVPLVSMADLAWRIVSGRPELGAQEAGVTADLLTAVFNPHSPLQNPLRTPVARSLIVASKLDHIVPPEHPQALWEHWGRPQITWVEEGHDALFHRSSAFRSVCDFLESHTFIKRPNSADLPLGS